MRPDQDRCPCGCPASPTEGDEQIDKLEGIVLMVLLDPPNPELGHHLHDLSRELHRERVLVEAVMGRLVAGGLAVRENDWVSPTPAALYYHHIDAR